MPTMRAIGHHVDVPVHVPCGRPNIGAVRARTGLPARWVTGVGRLVARLRLGPSGMVTAVLFVCLSMTPSLLPRTWLVQGAVSGVSAVFGYGLGVGIGWVFRRAKQRPDRLVRPDASVVSAGRGRGRDGPARRVGLLRLAVAERSARAAR